MAEAVIGGAVLSGFLQVLFDRLASGEVLNPFSKRRTNVDGLLKKLKRKLLLLDVVLDDADVKQFTNKKVRSWSDEARDAVYQADDILSEITYEARRRQVESDPEYQSSMSQVKSTLISSSYFTSFDDYIEPKLGEMLQLLEDLIQEAASLGLKEGVRRGVNMPANRSSSSVVVATDVYGRDSEKEKLIERLLQLDETSGTNETVDVIPVVAMGGMGKTTLAQLAYNDLTIDSHFNMKAWVCVSEEFDVSRVTKTILESIHDGACSATDLNQVQESLKKKLNGNKFLVVLDDVWNENYIQWDIFKTPFRSGAPGSKIIVTTRIQGAADIMKTGPVIINLPELSDDDCWSLFSGIAFGGRNHSSYAPQLEEIGRKIVKRCRGLPLAVKSLAGLLRSKQLDVGEWEDVLNSEFWDLPEDKSDILPALRLSYHYLPSYLKQYFAFYSLVPKNFLFKENDMASLWIAQKFMLPWKDTSYEQEGKKCFRELLSMSFFQNCAFGYGESAFVMHNLIHDLAQAVSGQFFFRLDGGQPHEIPGKVRHCSYEAKGFRQLHAATEVNTLRTFLPTCVYKLVGSYAGLDILVLSRQKHMRALSLPHYDKVNDLANLIGSLIHLQYLDLSHTRDMQQLPESICKLYNLETLLLVGCSSLTNLPVEIGKLISLRRLDITGTNLTEMPIQTSQLKRLEYLSKFVVGKDSGLVVGGLKALNSLRGKLRILGLENVGDKKDALEAKLKEKEHIETLALKWGGVTDDSQHDREVLEYLQPHRNLKHLRIRNYGGTRFPDWLGDQLFTQMVSLRLEDCGNCVFMPPLGQLPCLKELSVKRMSCHLLLLGEEFLGSSAGVNQPFPSLEALCFENMFEWVTWCLPGRGEFPKLCKLEIINCPKLVGTLPEVNVATLVIERCPSLEASVPLSSSSSSIVVADCLRKLKLQWCGPGIELNWLAMSDLVELEISDLPSLQDLTSELSALTKLKALRISSCPNLLSLSNQGLPPMLTSLSIYECELLQSVVDGMVSHNTCSLKWLHVSSCPLLASFADNGLPTTLKEISFSMCRKLEFSLSDGIEMCRSVVELTLYGCLSLNPLTLLKLFPNIKVLQTGYDDNLSSLNVQGCPQGRGRLSNLTQLEIRGCKNLEALPEGMCDLFPSLEDLSLSECPEIESLFEVSLLSKLRCLRITDCEKLTSFQSDWSLHRLPSLRDLSIAVVKNEDVESFPNEGLLPSTLTSLTMIFFQNLKKLNWRGIRHLTSLQFLSISQCPRLDSLPNEGLPQSLLSLDIYDCPLLTPRCKKDIGDYWPKIAHIPNLFLD